MEQEENAEHIRTILLLYDRLTKPIFTVRGQHDNVIFDIPEEYFINDYAKLLPQMKKNIEKLKTKKNAQIIKVALLPKDVDETVSINLKTMKAVSKTANFTTLNPFHRKCAGKIIDILMKIELKHFVSASVKILLQDVNPYMFEYALSVVHIHRKELQHIPLPSTITHLPDFFLQHDAMLAATNEAYLVRNHQDRDAIEIKPTATDMEIENRLSYFREDMGINIHHWHWHLVYPHTMDGDSGIEIVNKDRRGELFYYMHQQVLARYNMERLSNGLQREMSLTNLRAVLPGAYFPKLGAFFIKGNMAPRYNNTHLKDVSRDNFNVSVTDLELWRDRILDAIHCGYVLVDGKLIRLEEDTGINVLGNMIESSQMSVDRHYYGNLHNMGHMLIAFAHDPDNRYLEEGGVMGNNKTAVRDPIFYRWHGFINDLFDAYHRTLRPYSKAELSFGGVTIDDVKLITTMKNGDTVEDTLLTIYISSRINIAHGLERKRRGPVYVNFWHFDHLDFHYDIRVNNDGEEKIATVRIFLGPANDECDFPIALENQRKMFIELDKFQYKIKAKSTTIITRKCTESSVTIPFHQMFNNIDEIVKKEGSQKAVSQQAYCGCGWPHYFLIPTGKYIGLPCELFIMLTDYVDDKVSDDNGETDCNCPSVAPSYCGLQNRKYPDKKPMGFPFDRYPDPSAVKLRDFLTPNMFALPITIKRDVCCLNERERKKQLIHPQ